MYLPEPQQTFVEGHHAEQEVASPINVELPLRVGLLVGFLIVLSIEGWLLIRVLVN